MINGSRLIKELLEENWNKANTSGREPSFSEYHEKRKTNAYNNEDQVLTYDRVSDEEPTSIGNVARLVTYRVSIDLRTNFSNQQAVLMEKEAKRIIRTNVNYFVPSNQTHSTISQQATLSILNTTPFSNSESSNTFHNYRRVIEIELESQYEEVE